MVKTMIAALAMPLTAAVPGDARDEGLTWGPCTPDKAGMECADLKVPVDRAKPDGRKITLRLGRLPATGRAEGSVLIAYGGPGAPGIAITRERPELWASLRRRMDVVTWDTRGYGAQFQGLSTALPCAWTAIPYPAYPRDAADFGRLSDANRGLAETCRYGDKELFANMSSADHAMDMDAIRKALGEKKLNFYGASYAGFYAQAYARKFPGNVRALVLDGTWSHSAANWAEENEAGARRAEATIGRFFTWCRETADCAWQGRDVPRRWRALVAAADRTPVPAKKAAGVAYDGEDLRWLVLSVAQEGPAAWPGLARTLRAAERGDASGLVPQAGSRYANHTTGVTECLDWPRFGGQAEAAEAARRIRAIAPNTGTARTLAAIAVICAGWPVPVTNPPAPLPKGLPPLLGAGAWNESDAVAGVLAQVPGSALVRHDGPGHTLYPFSACARGHIDAYLTDGKVPPKTVTC
ncbi:alpha/beta fold hydrolase [Spongiactinospora sp. TRM90649]|uniref:alpha/beta fold hydrolase n=1 Tax=Spongiactinospora sp. TRM90649 TaxID=3031114 RepID=UPI0023F97B89|nr:alpha/beta fold hydrolase [Spongiactinospora sp. TRM90649]MDF5755075.1 alpha/beta fold hydrolase [Spongiactinospora sp. TRM90649]